MPFMKAHAAEAGAQSSVADLAIDSFATPVAGVLFLMLVAFVWWVFRRIDDHESMCSAQRKEFYKEIRELREATIRQQGEVKAMRESLDVLKEQLDRYFDGLHTRVDGCLNKHE